MSTLEMPRWLTDKCYAILAIPPMGSMSSRLVWASLKRLSWEGTFGHARKILSANKDMFQRGLHGWSLTAKGYAFQQMMLQDMNALIAHHGGRALWSRNMLDAEATDAVLSATAPLTKGVHEGTK